MRMSCVRTGAAANRLGLGHLAFAIDDVGETLEAVLRHGGRALGEQVVRDVPGVGRLSFVYATDPEDNILEWRTGAGLGGCLWGLRGRLSVARSEK